MHLNTRRLVSTAIAVFAAVALVGCGTSSSGGGHGAHGGEEKVVAPVDGASEVTVTAVDIDFQPKTLELTAGEPTNVTITNEGKAEHDFTLEEADVHVNVGPGESKTTAVTIDEPGRYEVKCTVDGHAEAGMTINVVVS